MAQQLEAVSKSMSLTMMTVSSAEWTAVSAKAHQVEGIEKMLESSHSLVDEHRREIDVLKETLDAILTQTRQEGGKVLQHQVDEIKKMWSQELAANSILRGLVSKTQADALESQHNALLEHVRLKEEFDELATLYEAAENDLQVLHEKLIHADRLSGDVEVRLEQRVQLLHMDHQRQLGTQQDLFTKERASLKALVSSMDLEKNKLQAEMHRLGDRLSEVSNLKSLLEIEVNRLKSEQSRIADQMQSQSDRSGQEVILLRSTVSNQSLDLDETSKQYQAAKLKIRSLEQQLDQVKAQLAHQTASSAQLVASRESELGQVSAALEESEIALANSLSDLKKIQGEYESLVRNSHSHKEYSYLQDALESERQNWLTERSSLETHIHELQSQFKASEHKIVEQRIKLQGQLDDQIRSAVAAEQQKSRDVISSRTSELHARYGSALEEVRELKRVAEEQAVQMEREMYLERTKLLESLERERLLKMETPVRILNPLGINPINMMEQQAMADVLETKNEALNKAEHELSLLKISSEQNAGAFATQLRNLEQNLREQAEYWNVEKLKWEEEILAGKRQSQQLWDQLSNENASSLVVSLEQRIDYLETLLKERETQLQSVSLGIRDEAVAQRIQMLEQALGEKQYALSQSNHQLEQLQTLQSPSALAMEMAELKTKAENQIRFERERAKRLAYKIEDLKVKNSQLKKQVEVGKVPTGFESEAQMELSSLRLEMVSLKTTNGEVLNILRDTLVATVGHGAIDISDLESNKVRINLSKLREQCSTLIHDIDLNRALVKRLMLWRADLKYQKLYLSLKVQDLLSSHKATLQFIHGMGVSTEQPMSHEIIVTPIHKLRRCANAICAIHRMKRMAVAWQAVVSDHGPLFDENGLDLPLSNGSSKEHLPYADSVEDPAALLRKWQELSTQVVKLQSSKSDLEAKLRQEATEKRELELENERLLKRIRQKLDSAVARAAAKEPIRKLKDPREWVATSAVKRVR